MPAPPPSLLHHIQILILIWSSRLITIVCNAMTFIMENFVNAASNVASNAMYQLKRKVNMQTIVALNVRSTVRHMLICTSKFQSFAPRFRSPSPFITYLMEHLYQLWQESSYFLGRRFIQIRIAIENRHRYHRLHSHPAIGHRSWKEWLNDGTFGLFKIPRSNNCSCQQRAFSEWAKLSARRWTQHTVGSILPQWVLESVD